jgi:hypothetical protein
MIEDIKGDRRLYAIGLSALKMCIDNKDLFKLIFKKKFTKKGSKKLQKIIKEKENLFYANHN